MRREAAEGGRGKRRRREAEGGEVGGEAGGEGEREVVVKGRQ